MTPKELSLLAAAIAADLPSKDRWIMTYRPRICPFHVLLERVPGGRILDVGCGRGLWLHLLWRSGRISGGVGMDVNPEHIRQAAAMRHSGDCLEFVHVPPGGEWPKGDFDCVTMIDVLHHVPPDEQEGFVAKAAGIDAPTLIFKDIDPADRLKAAMNTLHDKVLSGERPRYRAPSEVAGWIEDAGYQRTGPQRCDMLWYSHYYILGERK